MIAAVVIPVREIAVQNEEFEADRRLQGNFGARSPTFECDHFMPVPIERHDFHPCPHRIALVRALGGVDAHLCAIGRSELPQLHEDRTAGFRARRVRGSRWIANVRAGGIIAMLILEYTLEHEEFFPALMRVAREVGMRSVADDGGGARHLPTDPIQHAALDASSWRGRPFERRCMDHCALREIRIELHDAVPVRTKEYSAACRRGHVLSRTSSDRMSD